MGRIHGCHACNMISNGVKSRIALKHTCGEHPTKVGKDLQKKVEDAKDDAVIIAILQTDISGMPRNEARLKLSKIINQTLENF
jgi:hypothetical protein